jgi:hypothetical protein
MLRELLDEETGLEEFGPDEWGNFEPQDELAVRRLMIRLEQVTRDRDTIKKRKAAVVASYDEQIARFDSDEKFIRSSLQVWCERHGKTTFPDVGTVSLAKGDPKIEVDDKDALKGHVGEMFTKTVFDETEAKRYALERALEGELLPGVKFVPGGPSLRVRKAAG